MIRILLLSVAMLTTPLPAQTHDQIVACRQRYLDVEQTAYEASQTDAKVVRKLAYYDLERSARYASGLVNAQSYGQLCQAQVIARLSAAVSEMREAVAAQTRAEPGKAAASVAAALDKMDTTGGHR